MGDTSAVRSDANSADDASRVLASRDDGILGSLVSIRLSMFCDRMTPLLLTRQLAGAGIHDDLPPSRHY